MKRCIQLLAIGLFFLATNSVFAAQVTITCPNFASVKIKNGIATGKASRNDGELPIFLRGDTNSTIATKFTGGALMAGMLSCTYEGNADDFGIVNYWISGDLRACRFNKLTYQCLGNSPKACQLICEK